MATPPGRGVAVDQQQTVALAGREHFERPIVREGASVVISAPVR